MQQFFLASLAMVLVAVSYNIPTLQESCALAASVFFGLSAVAGIPAKDLVGVRRAAQKSQLKRKRKK